MVVSKKQGAFSYKLNLYNFPKNIFQNLIHLFERIFVIFFADQCFYCKFLCMFKEVLIHTNQEVLVTYLQDSDFFIMFCENLLMRKT